MNIQKIKQILGVTEKVPLSLQNGGSFQDSLTLYIQGERDYQQYLRMAASEPSIQTRSWNDPVRGNDTIQPSMGYGFSMPFSEWSRTGFPQSTFRYKKPVQPITLDRPKEPTFELTQEQQYLPQKEQHLEFDPIGLKKGTYFTRPRQQQEAGQGKTDYFDSKTGKLLKTMQSGGALNYTWATKEPSKTFPVQSTEYQPYSENINLDAYLKATQLFGDGVSFINPFVGRLISAPGDINDIVKNPKDIKNYITPLLPAGSKAGIPSRQAAKIDRFNTFLTGVTTLSDLPEETWQTPKKQNGGSINKYPNGGKKNITITTGTAKRNIETNIFEKEKFQIKPKEEVLPKIQTNEYYDNFVKSKNYKYELNYPKQLSIEEAKKITNIPNTYGTINSTTEAFDLYNKSYEEDDTYLNNQVNAINYYDKQLNWLKNNMENSKYTERLKKEFGNNVEQILLKRKNNLLNSPIDVNVKSRIWNPVPETPNVQPEYDYNYDENTGEDIKTKTGKNRLTLLDPEYAKSRVLNGKKIIPTLAIHEGQHLITDQNKGMSDYAKNLYRESYLLNNNKESNNQYYSNPTEMDARKKALDFDMEKLGIKKYEEDFKPKHYKKILKLKNKLSDDSLEFLNIVKPENMQKIFNTIAYNKPQEQIPMAKNGGSIKKYGKGGSIKDDIININGDYYNNDIIDGLDRDARVLNNQENKFLNRYGVTDRNSFYNKFPTEEIFNFKNGSDKARHYGLSTPYVDETTITLKNGGSINKYPNGGRPQFEWSKGIDNIQPITQTQNNSSITTGNKKLSTEELKKAAEYTKKYNQQHLEEEYNNRQNKLKQSIDAQKQPLSLKNLQTQTQSTGDKLSLAMNSKYGNPKDYPTLSGYIQGLDYINPFKMIGDMASGLGSVPQDIKEGNYLRAGLSVASPLAVGAIAGVGANSVKPFVNNLVNPLAGTGEAFSNLYKEQIYKAFEPVGYGAKEKILNSPKTWVRNTFIKSPEERAKHIGSQLSNNENLFEEVGKNRLDAWRTGLGLNQKWDTFEKIGENSYRIKNMKPSVGEFSSIYNDLNANEINKMGYYSGENPLIGLTEKHEKVTSPKIQTEYGLTDINDIRKYLRKGDKVAPWEQYRIVEPSKNKDFSHSVYDTDKQGIMGSFRWDINKPSYPDYNIHYQSNDTWDLNPFENRGATQLKNNHELSKFHFKPLENLEALKLVGGKPFNIQNNFLVDPKTYEIKKSFKNGGNITKESEWELVNETNKKLPKRRLNLDTHVPPQFQQGGEENRYYTRYEDKPIKATLIGDSITSINYKNPTWTPLPVNKDSAYYNVIMDVHNQNKEEAAYKNKIQQLSDVPASYTPDAVMLKFIDELKAKRSAGANLDGYDDILHLLLGKDGKSKAIYDKAIAEHGGINPYKLATKLTNDYFKQNGGQVNTLEGDLYSKILLNRNKNLDFIQRAKAVGQFPESNMFQQFDPNEFGKKNSHLMGWDEDENGQAYMSPSIFNDRNEAIKVPNQYAGYISNVGYKNVTGIPTKQNGGMSQLGYKQNSPYENNPFNLIDSNQITMKGVTKEVIGISNTGDIQEMKPNREYKFEGNQVLEFPKKGRVKLSL